MEEVSKKTEKKKKTHENVTELQKPSVETDHYNHNKNCEWTDTCTYTPISKIKTVQQQQQQIKQSNKNKVK